MKALLTLIAVWIAVPGVYAQGLSVQEKSIVEHVGQHHAEAVSLLEKIVNIESPTENLDGVRQVGMVLKAEFEALGMSAGGYRCLRV